MKPDADAKLLSLVPRMLYYLTKPLSYVREEGMLYSIFRQNPIAWHRPM